MRQHVDDEVRRLEGLIQAEGNLRRARREDDNRALEKAETALTRRLDAMNEIRDQLREQAQTFVRSDYIEEQIKSAAGRNEAQNKRIEMVERWQFKLIGGLVLATVVAPFLTALVVYALTRHAIPTR